jgi:flagellum-specific peptidoglycan hydrolase FlgJ
VPYLDGNIRAELDSLRFANRSADDLAGLDWEQRSLDQIARLTDPAPTPSSAAAPPGPPSVFEAPQAQSLALPRRRYAPIAPARTVWRTDDAPDFGSGVLTSAPNPATPTPSVIAPGQPAAPATATSAPAAMPQASQGAAASAPGGAIDNSSREAFVRSAYPYALQAAGGNATLANQILATAISENGAVGTGKDLGAAMGHNYAGIHGEGPAGSFTALDAGRPTTFAAYGSAAEGIGGFVRFIRENPRYAQAVAAFDRTGDVDQLMRGVAAQGYAEDPIWGENQIAIRKSQVEPITAGLGAASTGQPQRGAYDLMPVTPSTPTARVEPVPNAANEPPLTRSDPRLQYTQQALADAGDPDAWAKCGPVAAFQFAQKMGRAPTPAEVEKLARDAGWTPQRGMAGFASEAAVLAGMGIAARSEAGVDWDKVITDVSRGNPVILELPGHEGHYVTAQGYDPQTGKIDFGSTVGDLKAAQHQTRFTPSELEGLGWGTPSASLYVDNPATPAPSVAAGGGPQGSMWSPDSPVAPATAQMSTGRGAGGIMARLPLAPTMGPDTTGETSESPGLGIDETGRDPQAGGAGQHLNPDDLVYPIDRPGLQERYGPGGIPFVPGTSGMNGVMFRQPLAPTMGDTTTGDERPYDPRDADRGAHELTPGGPVSGPPDVPSDPTITDPSYTVGTAGAAPVADEPPSTYTYPPAGSQQEPPAPPRSPIQPLYDMAGNVVGAVHTGLSAAGSAVQAGADATYEALRPAREAAAALDQGRGYSLEGPAGTGAVDTPEDRGPTNPVIRALQTPITAPTPQSPAIRPDASPMPSEMTMAQRERVRQGGQLTQDEIDAILARRAEHTTLSPEDEARALPYQVAEAGRRSVMDAATAFGDAIRAGQEGRPLAAAANALWGALQATPEALAFATAMHTVDQMIPEANIGGIGPGALVGSRELIDLGLRGINGLKNAGRLVSPENLAAAHDLPGNVLRDAAGVVDRAVEAGRGALASNAERAADDGVRMLGSGVVPSETPAPTGAPSSGALATPSGQRWTPPPALSPEEITAYRRAAAASEAGRPMPPGATVITRQVPVPGRRDQTHPIPYFVTSTGHEVPLPPAGRGGAGPGSVSSTYQAALSEGGGYRGRPSGIWTDAAGNLHRYDSPQEVLIMHDLDTRKAAGDIQDWWHITKYSHSPYPELEALPYFKTTTKPHDTPGFANYEPDFLVRYKDGSLEVVEAKGASVIAGQEDWSQKPGNRPQLAWNVGKKAAGIIPELADRGVGYRIMTELQTSAMRPKSPSPHSSGDIFSFATVPGVDWRDLPELDRGMKNISPGSPAGAGNKIAAAINDVSKRAVIMARDLKARGVETDARRATLTRFVRDELIKARKMAGQDFGELRDAEAAVAADAPPWNGPTGRLTRQQVAEQWPEAADALTGAEQNGARIRSVTLEHVVGPDDATPRPRLFVEAHGDPQAVQRLAAQLGDLRGAESDAVAWHYDTQGPTTIRALSFEGADPATQYSFAQVQAAINATAPEGTPRLISRYTGDGKLATIHAVGQDAAGNPIPAEDVAIHLNRVRDVLQAFGIDATIGQPERGFLADFAAEGGYGSAIERREQVLGLRPLPRDVRGVDEADIGGGAGRGAAAARGRGAGAEASAEAGGADRHSAPGNAAGTEVGREAAGSGAVPSLSPGLRAAGANFAQGAFFGAAAPPDDPNNPTTPDERFRRAVAGGTLAAIAGNRGARAAVGRFAGDAARLVGSGFVPRGANLEARLASAQARLSEIGARLRQADAAAQAVERSGTDAEVTRANRAYSAVRREYDDAANAVADLTGERRAIGERMDAAGYGRPLEGLGATGEQARPREAQGAGPIPRTVDDAPREGTISLGSGVVPEGSGYRQVGPRGQSDRPNAEPTVESALGNARPSEVGQPGLPGTEPPAPTPIGRVAEQFQLPGLTPGQQAGRAAGRQRGPATSRADGGEGPVAPSVWDWIKAGRLLRASTAPPRPPRRPSAAPPNSSWPAEGGAARADAGPPRRLRSQAGAADRAARRGDDGPGARADGRRRRQRPPPRAARRARLESLAGSWTRRASGGESPGAARRDPDRGAGRRVPPAVPRAGHDARGQPVASEMKLPRAQRGAYAEQLLQDAQAVRDGQLPTLPETQRVLDAGEKYADDLGYKGKPGAFGQYLEQAVEARRRGRRGGVVPDPVPVDGLPR